MAAEDTGTPQDEPVQERPVAVITGASSGIGMATAIEFARQGYDVVLAARRKAELEEAAKQCREEGAAALVVPVDTTDDKAVQNLAERAIQQFHHINVWVNDAGVYLTGAFEAVPLEDMRRVFDTNFFGYVHGSRAALIEFKRQGYGTLINVSSVNAAAPQPYVAIYSASKAAVRALDESLRMELRLSEDTDDIHVCTVLPASIDTNLFRNSANYTGKEIQALEPVYDPAYVATQIVRLAHRPKREIIVGQAGKLMALQRAHMPGMYEKRMSRYTRKDMLSEHPAVLTDGNLFEPNPDSHGIRDGWRSRRMRADRLNLGLGIGLAASLAAAAGIAYGVTRRRQKSVADEPRSLLHAIFG